MTRNIINGSAFQLAIEEALEELPAVLQNYHPALKSFYGRTTDRHATIHRARRRKEDPAWAHRKFHEGVKLYRFNGRRKQDLLRWIRCDFDGLAEIAVLAQQRGRPMAREAGAFLKGLRHKGGRSFWDLWLILANARSADVKAMRHQILREPAERIAGALVASRCSSLDAIIRLGRFAENCLDQNETYWDKFVSGEIDIWSFREHGLLVAIATVNRVSNEVVEALAPRNRGIAYRHICDVALFSRNAGFSISKSCEASLVEYFERRCWDVKSWRWTTMSANTSNGRTQSRIDIGGYNVDVPDLSCLYPPTTVSLVFSPAFSCVRTLPAPQKHSRPSTVLRWRADGQDRAHYWRGQNDPELRSVPASGPGGLRLAPELNKLRALCPAPELGSAAPPRLPGDQAG